MTRQFTLDQLRGLLRPETALVGLVIIALVSWYYMNNKVSEAEAAIAQDQQSLKAARDDLSYWSKNFDQLALIDELATLKEVPAPPDLPGKTEALAYRTDLLKYAVDRLLPLSSLEVTDINRSVGDFDFPGVRYNVVISGNLQDLIGVLGLSTPYPTSSIQELDFFQADGAGTTWVLTFTMDVLYQVPEPAGGVAN